MSKGWKITIGVIVGVIVIAAIVVSMLGRFVFGWDWGRWRSQIGVPYSDVVPVEVMSQVPFRLVDDDGDGVPDRGVIDVPMAAASQGFVRSEHFGRGFGPGHGRSFGPFGIVRGLPGLILLGLVIALIVYLFRRRGRSQPAKPQQGE